MQKISSAVLYRSLSVLSLLVLLWHGPLLAATESGPSARDLVITTSEDLITNLQEHKEAIQQDRDLAYRLAEDTVLPHLDFPRITRWVLGKYWRTATEDQRQRLTTEFRTLLTRSYVSAMVTYTDQILQHADNVQFPAARSRQDGDTATVTMLINLEAGPQVTVQYQMYQTDTGWKIYDVQIEGISLALTYRSTFSQEITRGGIEGLIAMLAARNRQALHEPPPHLMP